MDYIQMIASITEIIQFTQSQTKQLEITVWTAVVAVITVITVMIFQHMHGRLRVGRSRPMRTVAIQSQTTYRIDLATPRFQVLPQHQQGCWEEEE